MHSANANWASLMYKRDRFHGILWVYGVRLRPKDEFEDFGTIPDPGLDTGSFSPFSNIEIWGILPSSNILLKSCGPIFHETCWLDESGRERID